MDTLPTPLALPQSDKDNAGTFIKTETSNSLSLARTNVAILRSMKYMSLTSISALSLNMPT